MTTRLALVVTLISLIVVPPAAAQSESKITGVVRDATALVIAGATLTATNRTTRETRTATTGVDGTYAIAVPLGSWFVTAAFPGFRTSTQTVDVTPGESKTADFTLETMLSEEITVTATKREETLLDVPFSVAAPPEEMLRERGVDDIEDVAANVAGFTVQNLGPGQSQVAMRGVSAGQIVRDQPGVKEQVGVYLDESVISLSLFTPDLDLFDIEPRRGAARTAGHAVRLRLAVRHGALHHQPAGARRHEGVRRTGGIAGVNGGSLGGRRQGRRSTCRSGDKAALRVAAYFDRTPASSTPSSPTSVVKKDVNDGFRDRRARGRSGSSRTTTLRSRRASSTSGSRPTAGTAIDIFNILANPFTTTRPAVTLGEREQFTQLEEQFTDDFVLGDVNIDYNLGDGLAHLDHLLHRSRRARRSATRPRSPAASPAAPSVCRQNVYTLDAPLNDATKAKVWTQELRCAGGNEQFHWVAGGVLQPRRPRLRPGPAGRPASRT